MSLPNASTPAASFSVHGHAVKLRCAVVPLHRPLESLLGEFLADLPQDSAGALEGAVRLYNEAEVVRRLPTNAARISAAGDLMEIYQLDEQFWIIDDRWGMIEMDLVRGSWRSWVLPDSSLGAFRTAELAVLWPMAQLLGSRGLCLLPAASVWKDDFCVLMLAPFNIEPELTAMSRAGYHIIGQRWTALREEEGRVSLLHMPGLVERAPGNSHALRWTDLCAESTSRKTASCNAVMVVERGRRPVTLIRPVPRTSALMSLRRAWPIQELRPHRRHGQLVAAVSRQCRIFEMRLSRQPDDVLKLLMDARHERTPAAIDATVIARGRRVVA